MLERDTIERIPLELANNPTMDNAISLIEITIEEIDALNTQIEQLRKDNQSLVQQVNQAAKKIDGLCEFIGGLDDCDIFDQNNLSRELETYFKGVTND